MELRSRSRSKTPLQTQSFIEAEAFEGSNHVTVTRSSRRTATFRTTSGGTAEEFYSTTKPASKTKSTKLLRNIASKYKTSDYSSEEGELESFTHISENEKNQIIEDAKAAANGTSSVSALNLYLKAGRYWDKYPKTDYTYSPHSRDRVEIAPGVVQMPNMSRRTIHSHDTSTNTDSYFDRFISRSQNARQRLFRASNNNAEEKDDSYTINRVSQRRTFISTITSFFYAIYSVIFWCFYSVYAVLNSSTIWLAKKFHHLASRVMLLDTWLLRKRSRQQNSRAVVVLCLLPLLIFAAWWLLSSLGSAIHSTYLNPSTKPIEVLPPATAAPISTNDRNQNRETSSRLYPALPTANLDEIVEQVLNNPKIHNILNLENDSQREQELLNLINNLKEEIAVVRKDLNQLEQMKNADLNKIASQLRTESVRNIAYLTRRLNRCCTKPSINLEPLITDSLRKLLNDPAFLNSQQGLSEWLHALFVAKQELETHLTDVTRTLNEDFRAAIDASAKQVMSEVAEKLTTVDPASISEDQIRRVVKSALAIYDADKTGLVDYAMEPMGGQIVTTRCTESYHTGTAVLSVLGIPLWYPSNSPRVVIAPGIHPGECWAFQNFPGFVVIKLAARVRVDAFSMEHVSRLLVPDGRIDSAPKEFEVYGLDDEDQREPVKLGEYVYDYDGDAVQFFAAHAHGLVFSMVEVRVKSNHGNPNYTCLYRFRVHGSLSHEPT